MTEEKEIPWGQVVESDKVYSAKTDRWFTVEKVTRQRSGVVVKAEELGKPWPPIDPQKMVKVQRGATGKAVDVIIIAFSGEMKS